MLTERVQGVRYSSEEKIGPRSTSALVRPSSPCINIAGVTMSSNDLAHFAVVRFNLKTDQRVVVTVVRSRYEAELMAIRLEEKLSELDRAMGWTFQTEATDLPLTGAEA